MTTPDDNQTLFARATAAHGAGEVVTAEALYRELLSRNPRVTPAHNNLGMILDGAGKPEEAEHCFRTALSLRPDYPEALNNLGAVLRRLHHYEEACKCFAQALMLRPGNVEALINLAATRQEMGDAEAAFDLFNRALALNPAEYRTLWGLAQFYSDCGKPEEAIAALSEAARINPGAMNVRCGLFTQRMAACDWQIFDSEESEILEGIRAGKQGIPPFLAISIASTASDQLRCAETYAASLGSTEHVSAYVQKPSPGKVRLGYISCDFHEHPLSHLAVELYERHDRSRFEVLAYSHGYREHSPMRARLEKAFDRFIDLDTASDQEAARKIAADGVDILIDLAGYTRYARTGILSRRPAPIQVNYLGYPSTMGVNFMDYCVVDQFVVPPEQRTFFSEELVYLPDCYQISSHRDIAPDSPTRSERGLPETGFVFCCFNNISKIRPVFFDVWMRLLRQVPGSVLWLLAGHDVTHANLRREAQARGVEPDRLIFAPRLPLADHLARHRLADIFLDTLPYNAHTTMSDALWAGLPAVTCVGDTFPGRVGGSILRAVGLEELVTHNLEEYEARALYLATALDALARIRQKLLDNRFKTPLFDCSRFTRNLEIAYTQMWNLRCEGKSPETISVATLLQAVQSHETISAVRPHSNDFRH
ncbi:MAG: tetratricopeptide repeat protein [Rhodospirillaceae bacterium]|nr:tetratricopeptide repeat protein [Rhodospirillaceae bacterium]